jgi:hypothetical protein
LLSGFGHLEDIPTLMAERILEFAWMMVGGWSGARYAIAHIDLRILAAERDLSFSRSGPVSSAKLAMKE